MIRKTIVLAAALVLSGCATCERHREVCNAVIVGVGAAVIVGLSASEWHSGGCQGCVHPMPQVRVK